jgi:hypothetical protein
MCKLALHLFMNIKKYFFLLIFLHALCSMAQTPLFKQLQEQEGLLSNKIYDIAFHKNLIWIAGDKGISSYDGKRFTHYYTQQGLPENEHIKLQVDAQNRLWAVSASAKLSYWQKEKFIPISSNENFAKALNNRIVSTISSDNAGDIYVSTVLGGSVIKINDFNRIENINMEWARNASFYVRQLNSGTYIWGSNGTSALNKKLKVIFLKHTQEINLSASQGYSKATFIKLFSGEYLFAKDQEIIHFNDSIVIGRSFLEKNIECLYEDKEGKIWIGLNGGGAVCFPMGTISSGGYFSYFGNKTISGICEDHRGNLWLSSLESGLFYLPSNPYSNYTPPQIFSTQKLKDNKTSNQAKQHNQENNSEIIKTQLVENPEAIQDSLPKNSLRDTLPPLIYISGIKINERDTGIQTIFLLGYKENFIKINYAGISAVNTQKIQYRYKLSDFDKDWIYTDNTFAQYNALPPGEYLFSVSAMNIQGVWSKETANIFLKISPPFWQTGMFLFSALLAGALFISFVFIVRIKQIKKREQEKTLLHKRISDIELQALRAQMNPHFIFNTLASIQYFITENNVESANQYLSKFAKLMRSIIYNSRRKTVPIKDEIQALELYIQMEQLRCNHSFDYKINASKNIDLNDDEIPGLLIQPYVENAIWHGLMHKKDKSGMLKINMEKREGILWCVIDDNGIGRKKSMQQKAESLKPHQSVGMSITKERLDILNAVQNSKLSVNIIDKTNPATQEAEGTRVEICIPLNE